VFREAANLGVDIQLKILQALPPLLQNYPDELHSTLLGEILLICAILQGSKMGVVNNTAAASTLVFELPKAWPGLEMLRVSSTEPDCDIDIRQGGHRRWYGYSIYAPKPLGCLWTDGSQKRRSRYLLLVKPPRYLVISRSDRPLWTPTESSMTSVYSPRAIGPHFCVLATFRSPSA
jgi:hypothetical protein